VEWPAIAFFALLTVLLAIAIGQSFARGRALDEIREELGGIDPAERAGGSDEDETVAAVGRLRRRLSETRAALDRRTTDLQQLVDALSIGVVRFGDDLRVEAANTAAHHFLRRDSGTLIGRTAIEALGDHRFEALVRQARETGAGSGEVALHPPAGPVLVARARRSPVAGIWLVMEDIGELHRLRRIRAEFVDNLSHELRTPITTVGLLAETLGRDADGAEPAVPIRMRERITKLQVETGHIAQMVEELLDLARIEGGAAPLHLDDVAMGPLVSGAVERLRLFAERQGIELSASVPVAPVQVRGDAARLGQVFANLIHNAVKFSPSGGQVEVRLVTLPDGLEVAVADRGIGIAAADLPRIFERFYKADRARVRGGGTGLGLSIARHIVEGHGGRIGVVSHEGVGSTFTVWLPNPPATKEPAA
jgi:two-component system phosphate regulon sensor histidine kinase PhoR